MLNPITPHGSVVVNAGYDYQHYATHRANDGSDQDNFAIKKKDLVFSNKRLSKRRRTAYNEPDLHVISTTNGVKPEQLDHEEYAFVGISHAHIDSTSHRHAAVTVSGLTTIKNTGPTRIEAGDKIVWDLEKRPEKKRKTFQTVPYHRAFEGGASKSLFKDVEACINADCKLTGTMKNESVRLCAVKAKAAGLGDKFKGDPEKMYEFLKCYTMAMSRLNSRVIGTALSRADEGAEFDILLRHSH